MNRIRFTSNEKGNEQNCAENLVKIVCICLEYWNLESIQSPDNLSHFFAAAVAAAREQCLPIWIELRRV